MKKFLSIFLALTLMIGLIPTAFADDTTTELTSVTYKFASDSTRETSNTERLEMKSGIWKYADYPKSDEAGKQWKYLGSTISTAVGKYVFVQITTYVGTGKANTNEWIAFGIKVPETGTYALSGKAYMYHNASDCMQIYLAPMNNEISSLLNSSNTDIYGTCVDSDSDGYYARSGQTLFDNAAFSIFDGSKVGETSIYIAEDAINEGSVQPLDTSSFEELELNAGEYVLLFNNGSESTGALSISEITLTEVPGEESETTPEAAPDEVTYGVFVNDVNCASAVTANGTKLSNTTYGFATGTLTPGANLTATAEDNVSGYKFRYWVLGSAATGRYYSSDNTVTVNPYANIALTAIYTAVEQEKEYIDFFNWNGDYVDSKEITNGKISALPTATLTGYKFAHWLLEDNVTKLTSANYDAIDIPVGVSKAMAQYTALNGYDSSNMPEGTSATGWTRGGKHVSYSETYEFFKWLNDVNTIAPYDGETIIDKIPLAVLESNGNNYMLEYDKGGYTIVEAGILFGKDADVDVMSAYSKATVKNIKPHGQFTATLMENATAGMQSYARGYVMYEDTTGGIKVIYAE